MHYNSSYIIKMLPDFLSVNYRIIAKESVRVFKSAI